MTTDALELIDLYEQGVFTRGELIIKLIQLSLHIEPHEYLDSLPEDLRQDIRAAVRNPPASPELVTLIKYPTFAPGVDISEAIKKIDQAVYESSWKLHRYFLES